MQKVIHSPDANLIVALVIVEEEEEEQEEGLVQFDCLLHFDRRKMTMKNNEF